MGSLKADVVTRFRRGRVGAFCPALVAALPALLLVTGSLAGTAWSQLPAKPARQQWAILIGCEKYASAPKLTFIDNDVQQLSATLRERAGFDADHILEMTDAAAAPSDQPTKANLMAQIPLWLKKPAPGDSVLLFFSGHGLRDDDDKLYLAPIDVDPQDPVATGIAVNWLRQQIAGCRAGFKLLVLDSCHAGSEKGEDDEPHITYKGLGQEFGDLEKVVTLASSTAGQKSQIWPQKQQSLFTYWLTQGLKGHADADGDALVDIDELYKYVSRNVTRTAESKLASKQTPVRIVRPGTVDVPNVVALRPQRLQRVLTDMSEQLSDTLAERKLKSVGVLEFSNITPGGEEVLGGPFGLLGRYCAEELESRLIAQGEGSFAVVDRQRLQKALRDRNFGLADLGSSQALKDVAEKTDNMPVIACGTLSNRTGRIVNLRCRLVETGSDNTLSWMGGLVALAESEWAMLGRSASLTTADRKPAGSGATAGPSATGPATGGPAVEQVVARLDERARQPNPLVDKTFPFRIWLQIDGKERKGIARGNDYFVPVRKGEIYQIWVENRGIPGQPPQPVMMRLLVDGLNTLPEKNARTGATEWGRRVSLTDAKSWELDPTALPAGAPKVWAVRGFVTEVGASAKLREFVVLDADSSLAARQQFTDQVGIITAAFYAPATEGKRRLGTGAGREREESIRSGQGLKTGNLLGVVNIRYVDADALETASR